MLADGFADLAVLPVTFTPYMSQTLSWYTTLLGPPGKNGSEDWTNYQNNQFDQTVQTASEQLNPDTAAGYYSQADTQLWDEMVSLPLYRGACGARLEQDHRGRDSRRPVVRASSGSPSCGRCRQPESTNNTTPSLPGQ